jgi:hypothetical protein
MLRRYWKPDAERAADRARLETLRERIPALVPGAAVAADQAFREADLAIDVREDVPALPPAAIQRIIALFEAAGAQARLSSIHVNGWFGAYDKLSMSLHLLAQQFGVRPEEARTAVVFAGDSPNDAPLFAYFPNAVGVANVRDFAGRLVAEPAWVTRARGGAGFAELADALLAARR